MNKLNQICTKIEEIVDGTFTVHRSRIIYWTIFPLGVAVIGYSAVLVIMT